MKNIIQAFTFSLVMLVLPAAVHAQVKDALPAAVTSFIKALESGNEAALNALVSDKLSYGHSDGKVEDKRTFVLNLTNGNSDFVKIDITDQSITELRHLAIVRHKLEATTNNAGKPGSAKLHVMLIWQKEDGRWQLVARQATKIP